MSRAVAVLLALLSVASLAHAEDPYHYFTWTVEYGTVFISGVPQQVITINGQFPGPVINCTSNNNIVVNIFNKLDEPFLLSWNGIQHRKNSWQDGVPGTNCPIPPGGNFTYKWQPKDQIGSFYYFPSLGMHKAAGGYGPIRVHSRALIPVPFDPPADEFDVLISDWYGRSHKELSRLLDSGRRLTRPRAVLINGASSAKAGDAPAFVVESGKVYRYRVCNVGVKASLNFRIQGHKLKLVEIDGSHTVQNVYDSLDVHAGQCYSVLVTADQPPSDYFIVASTRFQRTEQTATAVIRYRGSNTPASRELPPAPTTWSWSLNQWRSFRWNLTASAARPNPQGSYHYGQINITRTIKLASSTNVVDGKLRFALNGVSHRDADGLPLKLAEYFGINGTVFQYNQIADEPSVDGAVVKVAPNVITTEFRTFIEIILENPETSIQSYHLNGYSFFPVGMGPGKWTPESRKTYNLLDAVSRHTIQVYPSSWTAIMLTFDNAGMWNLRSEIWDRRYLGQQLYVSVLSPERSLRDEYNMPENALRCGAVVGLPLPPPYS